MSRFQAHVENGFCNSDQKSMLMVGFLTCNDSDILRAKTGPYRRIGYQTNIPPTTESHFQVLEGSGLWFPKMPGSILLAEISEGVGEFHITADEALIEVGES